MLVQKKATQVNGKEILKNTPNNSTIAGLSEYPVLLGLIDFHTHVLF
nr:hypothetical protein [uncultured Allomuricauda sp.]